MDNFDEKINRMKCVIVVHEHVEGGPGHNLRDYLLKKDISKLLFIAHPLLYMKDSYMKSSRYEFYSVNKVLRSSIRRINLFIEPLYYIKDFLFTVFWFLKFFDKYDVYIGLDPLNAFIGLLFYKIGLTKYVVYYSIDYFPNRFSNSFLNAAYHWLDKICVRNASETWNVGQRMAKARAEYNNMKGKEFSRQYHVPIGIWREAKYQQIQAPLGKKIVYVGHLIPFMGVDLVIRSMTKLVKLIPTLQLDIIGKGESEKDLKKLVKELKLSKSIHFFKWIEQRDKFKMHLSTASIGVATFNTNILDDKVKNADPGKIKDYMSVGLPVIVTKAIANYASIKKASVGIVIDYNQKDFINAVLTILKKDSIIEYKRNTIEYINSYDWNIIFSKNLKRLIKI